jgi:hypothetical protein
LEVAEWGARGSGEQKDDVVAPVTHEVFGRDLESTPGRPGVAGGASAGQRRLKGGVCHSRIKKGRSILRYFHVFRGKDLKGNVLSGHRIVIHHHGVSDVLVAKAIEGDPRLTRGWFGEGFRWRPRGGRSGWWRKFFYGNTNGFRVAPEGTDPARGTDRRWRRLGVSVIDQDIQDIPKVHQELAVVPVVLDRKGKKGRVGRAIFQENSRSGASDISFPIHISDVSNQRHIDVQHGHRPGVQVLDDSSPLVTIGNVGEIRVIDGFDKEIGRAADELQPVSRVEGPRAQVPCPHETDIFPGHSSNGVSPHDGSDLLGVKAELVFEKVQDRFRSEGPVGLVDVGPTGGGTGRGIPTEIEAAVASDGVGGLGEAGFAGLTADPVEGEGQVAALEGKGQLGGDQGSHHPDIGPGQPF